MWRSNISETDISIPKKKGEKKRYKYNSLKGKTTILFKNVEGWIYNRHWKCSDGMTVEA